MQEQQPFISVILPVRNASVYLLACLESVSSQTYTNFEIIAIDDFSSDNSFQILTNYHKKEKRLHISRNVKRYDIAVTLNRALKKAKGRYIAFMKAEDSNHKDRFKKQLAYLIAGKKTVAVGSQCYFLNTENKRLGKSTFPQTAQAIYQKPLHGVAVQFEGLMIDTHRIPKDILYFHTKKHPYLYSDILVKLLQYGQLANLPYYLYSHRKFTTDSSFQLKHVITTAKLWLRSEALFGYRPSFKQLLFPLLKIKMST